MGTEGGDRVRRQGHALEQGIRQRPGDGDTWRGWCPEDGDKTHGRGQGQGQGTGDETGTKGQGNAAGTESKDKDMKPAGTRTRAQRWNQGQGTEDNLGQDTRTEPGQGEGTRMGPGAAQGGHKGWQGWGGPRAHLGVRAEHVEPEDGGPGAGELVVVGDDDKGQRGGLGRGQGSGWLSPAPPTSPSPPAPPGLTSSSSSSPQ